MFRMSTAIFGIAVVLCFAQLSICQIVTVESDADVLAKMLFPDSDPVFTYQAGTAEIDFGIERVFEFEPEGETFSESDNPAVAVNSIGIFTNTHGTYGIGTGKLGGDGIVISSGSVLDYGRGPNNSGSQSTSFGSFDFFESEMEEETSSFSSYIANETQAELLTQVSGDNDFLDTTSLTIPFHNQSDNPVDLNLFAVFGTEETPDFVGTPFTDGFGVFLNGVNIALPGGLPVNVDHPSHLPVFGTQLDTVIAPATESSGFDPRIDLTTSVAPGENVLTLIIGDASDSVLDSTAYIARETVPGPVVGVPLLPGEMPTPGEPFVYEGVTAEPGENVYLDPEVSVGYLFEALPDPDNPDAEQALFSSVMAHPVGSDEMFTVEYGDGLTGILFAGEVFEFEEAVAKFTILDIDSFEMVPFDDPTAFFTVVTFENGISNGTIHQLPLTVAIPEPASSAVFCLLGGIALGGVRRRRV